jgi:integrase
VAFRNRGKQKLLAIGKYPDTSLLDARNARDSAKAILRAGDDPSRVKKTERLQKQSPGDSFKEIASEYVEKLRHEGRSAATMKKVEWLLDFALPTLGTTAIREISPSDVLSVLRTVEKRGRFETARRLRSTIGAVCRYAIATARAETDPTASLNGALTTPKVKSRSAIIDPKAFGALLRAIDGFVGQQTTHAALQLMALLFPRPGELRMASWAEFDFERAIWTIPSARTKMRRGHQVPLAKQAIKILKNLKEITGEGSLVFPSVRTASRPISDVTLNAALRRLGYSVDEVTAHGFRASAATLLNESNLWNADAIERQLAHIEKNDVRRAYTRGEHWDERVRMMSWWADHLDGLKSVGQVVRIGRKRA